MTKQVEKNLYRDIVETVRNTLDIDDVKQNIVNFTGKVLKADRCFILEYDKNTDKFLKPNKEYLSTNMLKSYIDVDLNENIPHLVQDFKKGKYVIFNQEQSFIDGEPFDINDGSYELEKIAIDEYKVYSLIVFPIYYVDNFLGDLIVHYVEKKHKAGEEEINLLKTVSNQMAVALYQSSLYKLLQKKVHNEESLRKITQIIRSSIKLSETKKLIVKTIGEVLQADRCFITDYDEVSGCFLKIEDEYRSSDDVKSVVGEDVNYLVPYFVTALKNGRSLLVKNKEIFLDVEKQNLSNEQEALKKYGIDTIFAVPLFYQNIFLGVLSVHYINELYEITDFEINLMKDIAYQVAIAIHHSVLYKKIQLQTERERLLRRIFEAIRSTLNINLIKNTIVNEIATTFNADICFIMSYDSVRDSFFVDEYSEYRSSNSEQSFIGFDFQAPKVKWFVDSFKTKKELNFSNIKRLLEENNLERSLEAEFLNSYNLKSAYNIPIAYGNKTGYLAIKFTKDYRELSEDDLVLLRTIAFQSGIALYQAELYETVKIQAQKERVSKNIIEILRGTIDKSVIKKLFVRNIGKLFNADRVFISEYDAAQRIFMPVEKDSEYLSSQSEKSVIGIDWSKNFVKDYYESILDRKEVKIYSFDEYIKGQDLNGDIVNLLQKFNIKSSYSFPILCQEKVIGFFCLDYTKQKVRLSEEDISNIRDMCIQAGVALHNSDLFSKSQEFSGLKDSCIKNMTESIAELKVSINKLSIELSSEEINRSNTTFCLQQLNEIVTRISNFIQQVQSHIG